MSVNYKFCGFCIFLTETRHLSLHTLNTVTKVTEEKTEKCAIVMERLRSDTEAPVPRSQK